MNVELSDEPEILPLTPTHIIGPLVLLASCLVLAFFVWLAELCFRGKKNNTNLVLEVGENEPNKPNGSGRWIQPITAINAINAMMPMKF